MFQSIGERFNIGITLVLKKLKECCRKCKEQTVSQTELTLVALVLCSAVLAGGAGAFHYFEGWDLVDAFYYCFITMSTIGFGDFVALQNTTMLALQTRPEYVAFSILYILFGLTVFAAALNLMVLRLLTMNTEDERKDELEALQQQRNAVKVDGDVITRTQSTRQGKDVEGMQIQAIDESSNHCHPAVKKQHGNSNGVPSYNISSNIKKTGQPHNRHMLDASMLADDVNTHMDTNSQHLLTLSQDEEVAGVETVLTSPYSTTRLSKKRGSV